MCIDKPKSAEFLKNTASEMKLALTRNGVDYMIETFQKENEILKTELDRVNKENADLHVYIDTVNTIPNGYTSLWFNKKDVLKLDDGKPIDPNASLEVGDHVRTTGNAIHCSEDLADIGKGIDGVITHINWSSVCIKFDVPILKNNQPAGKAWP